MGGGVQERTKDVELTFAAIRSPGGALGAEKEILNYCVLITKSYQRKHYSVNTIYSLYTQVIPSGGVGSVRTGVNGPVPTLVLAATMQ